MPRGMLPGMLLPMDTGNAPLAMVPVAWRVGGWLGERGGGGLGPLLPVACRWVRNVVPCQDCVASIRTKEPAIVGELLKAGKVSLEVVCICNRAAIAY